MARPYKQTVDYFPHYCNSGKTLYILQSLFKNDGYAFWFKLLELLATSDGHFYDYSNPVDWQFLLAKTCVSDETANNIIQALIDLDAIDKDLAQHKIIWVQHFVDNITDVYKRRQTDLPTKPGRQPKSDGQPTQVSGDKIAGMIKHYEDVLGKTLTPMDYERIKDFADNYPDGWFEKAVDEVKNSPETIKAPMRYIETVMDNWKAGGENTLGKSRTKAHRGTPTTTEKLKESTTEKLR